MRSPAASELASPGGILQERCDRAGDGNVIVGVHEHAGLAVDHRVERTGDPSGDNRDTTRPRLQVDDAEPLTRRSPCRQAARHRQKRGLIEPPVALLVGHGSNEAHLARHAMHRCEPFEMATKRAVADDDPFGFRNPGED